MHDVDGRNAKAPAYDEPGSDRVLDLLWVVAACVACVVGCGTALVTLRADTGAGWLAVGALATSAVMVGLQGVEPLDLSMLLRIVRTAVIGAVGLLSLVALLTLSPGIALAIAGYLALLSPLVRRAVARGLAGLPTRPPARDSSTQLPTRSAPALPTRAASAPQATSDLEKLSDVDLCRAWRTSYVALQRAADSSELAAVAALRGGYLDELRRRDARAYDSWISSGARAASDPARYFCRGRRSPRRSDEQAS